mmetsp:Transcript_35249/g.80488  ORF Transcript_35249/g.80488 Transcript_35249/m.80488 type:complete len:286 (-) Transcript_35249:506-1363(-)
MHQVLLALEGNKSLFRLLDVALLEEEDSFGNLHLRRDIGQARQPQLLNHVVKAGDEIFLDHGRDKLGGRCHILHRHLAPLLLGKLQVVVWHCALGVVIWLLLLHPSRADTEQTSEALLGALSVAQSIVAYHEVEPCLQVGAALHDRLEGTNGILVLPEARERVANIAHNLETNLPSGLRDLVKSHPVHLDGGRIVALLVVDVAHVDAQAPTLSILFVFYNDGISVESLGVHFVGMVLIGKVEADRVCQVQVNLVQQAVGFAVFTQRPLLFGCLLGFLEGQLILAF